VNLDVVSIHHDPSVFADPERFNPNRFDVSFRRALARRLRLSPEATECVDAMFFHAGDAQALQLPGVRERAADVPRDEPGKAGDLRLRPPPRLPIQVSCKQQPWLASAFPYIHRHQQQLSSLGFNLVAAGNRWRTTTRCSRHWCGCPRTSTPSSQPHSKISEKRMCSARRTNRIIDIL